MRVFPVRSKAFRGGDLTVHEFEPVPPMMAYFEGLHTVEWNPLTKQVAETVKMDGSTAVQRGHDSGPGILHISIFNMFLPVAIATSKYKFHFAAAKVKACGSPVAMYYPMMMPPLTCAFPVSIPSMNGIVQMTTVRLGWRWRDFLAGCMRILVDIAVDLITLAFSKVARLRKLLPDRYARIANAWLARRIGPVFGSYAARSVLRAIAQTAVSGPITYLLGMLVNGSIDGPFGLFSIDLVNGEVRVFTWSSGRHWNAGRLFRSAGEPPAVTGGGLIDQYQDAAIHGLPHAE